MAKVYLIITIDTEEDQWDITREKPSANNIKALNQLQKIFDDHDVFPTYLVNYPVVDSDSAVEILSNIFSRGRCEIGAHLHPWNTPPIDEDVNERNSMMANLPYDLQLKKLKVITDYIATRFGRRPEVFRAGRWGIGKKTIEALIECGYKTDTSVTPFTSWERYGGPSFMHAPFGPYFLDHQGDICLPSQPAKILEVPVSIGYNRWPFRKWQKLDRMLKNKFFTFLHAAGIAYRLNILKKIYLSPENDNAKNMLNLTGVMLNHGLNVLNMNLHSNSLTPGVGPFAKNKRDVLKIYGDLETYLRELKKMADVVPVALSNVGELVAQGEI